MFEEECEQKDFVSSPQYWNSIVQSDEAGFVIETVPQKTYNAYVPADVPTPNHFYLSISAKRFSDNVADQLDKVFHWYIAEFAKEYCNNDKMHPSCNVAKVEEKASLELACP